MADTKTSDETSATVLTGAELLRVVQSATSKKTTAALLGHQFRGCRIERTTALTAQNVTAGANLTFQSAVLDTDTFWSAGTPTRITIPSSKGFKVANVSAAVRIDNQTADTWTLLLLTHKNAAGTTQRAQGIRTEAGATQLNLSVTMLSVPLVDGDYFEAAVTTESDTSIDFNASTSIALQITGMEP